LGITDRFFVNGYEIWEFTNRLGTIAGELVKVLYHVYVDGALHVADNTL